MENKKIDKKTTIIKSIDKITNDKDILYLSDKIKNRYDNNNIKKIIMKLLSEIMGNFNKSITEIKDTKREIVKISNNITVKKYDKKKIVDLINVIYKKIKYIYSDSFVENYARLTDIYFLRRALDKKYIKNIITYTGSAHSFKFIHVFVKYFNFKVTHVAKTKYPDLNVLNDKIKNSNIEDIGELFEKDPMVQCSDISSFPENFE